MSDWEFFSHGPAETRRIGARLGELAEPGDVYLLSGDLGSGKTTLTQGLAAGLGSRGRVTSPTFTLVNQYRGRLPLYHVDLYRLESPESIATIGLEDYLDGDGVTVVEWPERASDWLPEDRLTITLSRAGLEARRLRFEPTGQHYVEMVARLRAALEAE